jgi:hypothetical protein
LLHEYPGTPTAVPPPKQFADKKQVRRRQKRTYRRTRYFTEGELSRRVLSVLRQASGQPMTTVSITTAIVADKGFPIGEGALSEALTDMVLRTAQQARDGCQVRNQRKRKWALTPSLL